MPVADRHAEAHGTGMEEGAFCRWRGMDGRRSVSGGAAARDLGMRIPVPALGLLFATACAATLCTAPVCMAQKEPTFHVDVPLVNVFVSVTDKAGAPIGGLAKEDFELSENGKPQKIAVFERDTSAPLAIVMAVDLSGSMYKDFVAEQQAAQRFAKDVLRKQDRADLVAFADGTNEVTGFTGDAKRIAGGLNG